MTDSWWKTKRCRRCGRQELLGWLQRRGGYCVECVGYSKPGLFQQVRRPLQGR